MKSEKKKPSAPKYNKRFAPPSSVRTMDDLLKAAVNTPSKPRNRKMTALERIKQIRW